MNWFESGHVLGLCTATLVPGAIHSRYVSKVSLRKCEKVALSAQAAERERSRGYIYPTLIPSTPFSSLAWRVPVHYQLKGFRQAALGTNISHLACKIGIIL